MRTQLERINVILLSFNIIICARLWVYGIRVEARVQYSVVYCTYNDDDDDDNNMRDDVFFDPATNVFINRRARTT